MRFTVCWRDVSRRTGNTLSSGSMSVEARDRNEAEAKVAAELRRRPPVQSTEGVQFIVRA